MGNEKCERYEQKMSWMILELCLNVHLISLLKYIVQEKGISKQTTRTATTFLKLWPYGLM
jgi:hypothetical protein